MKILIVGAKASSLYNFRGHFLQLLKNMKFDVKALASEAKTSDVNAIELLGAEYIDYPVSRNGLKPKEDLKTYKALLSIFKCERPNIIFSYTIKPVIWGGLSARYIPNCRFYALITGLGFSFQKGTWKKKFLTTLVTLLYKVSLQRADKVIFQNHDNRQVFIDLGIVPKEKTVVVNGSGVDILHFKVKPLSFTPTFLLIARLLGDKGIKEYVKAATVVKQKYPDAIFNLVGSTDPSPDGISLSDLAELNQSNSVNYLGATDDVRPYIEDCNVFVLPSYHEGLPRTILEAMATGRPILTTNVAGCRETVLCGGNGWLVEKANVEQLAERMIWFINNQDKWQSMARLSRKIVEDKFDVYKVNAELIRIMELDK